jgi:putative endonuclease
LAAFWLRLKGYGILEKRYKTHVGEADLVARRGNSLVFIEVKARSTLEEGLMSITPRLKRRVTKAANYFITERPGLAGLDIRFDVIVVLPGLRVRHIENAWGF